MSAIATMWLFWLAAAACRLMILPLAPFTLAYSILIWLWFSFFLFSRFVSSFCYWWVWVVVVVGSGPLVPYGAVHGCCWVAACFLVSV